MFTPSQMFTPRPKPTRALNANNFGPTFTGVVTAVNLKASQDMILTGNRGANGSGKIITCTNLTAESSLAVSGHLTVLGTSNFGALHQILFSTNAGQPTVGTRSEGSKLILYPHTTPYSTDYCIRH